MLPSNILHVLVRKLKSLESNSLSPEPPTDSRHQTFITLMARRNHHSHTNRLLPGILSSLSTMRLHVLGPAFDLPSIDAECNATIALLKSQLDKEAQWTIIPSHNRSSRLPFLIDGDHRIHGFKNIARYISTHYPRSPPPYLSRNQRATSTALISLLETHAQILLDISLYISFENFYNTTRPAFTKILPWHANYIVPPALRDKARKRTAHLGLGSLDVEDVHDSDIAESRGSGGGGIADGVGKEKKFEDEARKRASLLLPRRETVGRLLMQRQGGGAVFKIHALAGNLFDVLDEVLGEQGFFLGTEGMEGLDCVVWGYVSLLLYAPVPQDWVRRLLRGKYPRLVRWVERVREEVGLGVDVEAVMELAGCRTDEEVVEVRKRKGMTLPWEAPARLGVGEVVGTTGRDLLARIPLLGFADPNIISSSQHTVWRRYIPTIALTLATAMGACGYYAFTTGLLVWPHGQEVHIFGRKQLSDYGHLGAALAGVSLLGRQAAQAREARDDVVDVSPVRVEVGVEGRGVR